LAELNETRSGIIPTRLPRGIHYVWLIVAVLAAVQIIGSSIGMAAGIMIPPLTDSDGKFGWSIGVIGIGMSIYYLVGAVCAPISGWLGDRFGAQKMMALGGVLYLVSMVLLGSVTELWQFFIVFGVLLASTQSISMVPLMASVSGWFRRRLGLGTGILWAAGGIGTAILAPLLGYLLENAGWNMTFQAVGVVGGGIILVLTPFLRNRPADIGLKPYGSSAQDPPPVERSSAMEKLRVKAFNQHMRRTKAFWNLPVVHALGCAGHGIVLIFSIPIAVEQGLSLTAAAGILTLISLVSILSRFLTPVLAENYGPRKVMASCLFIQGVTVFILFWAQDMWAFYLFASLFGLGFGGEWTGYLVINRQYFGNGPMGTCYGWQMTGALMGHAITTALAGAVIYLTGSYSAILALSIFFSLGGVAVIATLEPTSRILIPDWENSLPPEARTAPPVRQTPGAAAPAPAAGDS
jgi:MFS family permease